MSEDTYLTVRDIAGHLKIAEAPVRRWIKLGDLRAIDIGKGWRIATTDLERFLQRHQNTPRMTHRSGQRTNT